jgi:hypothetical protein
MIRIHTIPRLYFNADHFRNGGLTAIRMARRSEVRELCQTESGILNQPFAKMFPDQNPENLLSLCYLLADQGIVLLP